MVTVMIVDDDLSLQKMLERILELKGYVVLANVCDGKEAVEKYKTLESKPDIILMDYRMPVMNGMQATREIKELDHAAKFIFISGDETMKTQAFGLSVCDFLTKPVEIETLFATIDRCVGSASS